MHWQPARLFFGIFKFRCMILSYPDQIYHTMFPTKQVWSSKDPSHHLSLLETQGPNSEMNEKY
jgi:hypothetical protein